MNVPILCLVIISEALSQVKSDQSLSNVGTVLFSPIDLKKNYWSKTDIGLLQARRYFQNLIPYPNLMETLDEDCIQSLLTYFHDAFSLIDSEATDPETNSILTTALSDVIGGYLKLWVLPVAKFSYYGGTVSRESAVKFFDFYKDIQNYLGTNGKGWRKLDGNMLNSIAINVAPPSRTYTRSMKNPCEHLAYYQKTPKGIVVPTPEIMWDISSCTMFVPLRNESLVPLNLPNASNALFKYYDVAKNCIRQSNSAQLDDFEDRFQMWLTTNVVPHLYDEHLYLALGSVLTLMNRTKDCYNKIITSTSNEISCLGQNPYIASMKSHKMLIIGIILFFEIFWCIPALFYLTCCKKKKVGNKSCFSILSMLSGKSTPFSSSTNKTQAHKKQFTIFQRPKSRNIEIEAQFPLKQQESRHSIATGTRSNFSSAVYSKDILSIVKETNSKKCLKKVTQGGTISSSCKTLILDDDNSRDYSSICKKPGNLMADIYASDQSQRCALELMSTKTVTLITDDKSMSKINYPRSSHLHVIKTINKIERPESESKRNIEEKINRNELTERSCSDTICPCTPCFKTPPLECTQQESKHIGESQSSKLLNKEVIKQKSSHIQRNEKKKVKISKPSRRLVEITIDRPEAEISVGIISHEVDQFLNYGKPGEASFKAKESTNLEMPGRTRNVEKGSSKSVKLVNTNFALADCSMSAKLSKAATEDEFSKRETLNEVCSRVIECSRNVKARTEISETIDCSRCTKLNKKPSEIIDCSRYKKRSKVNLAVVECLDIKQQSNTGHEVNTSSKSGKQSKIPKRSLKSITLSSSIRPPSIIKTSSPIPKRKSLIPRKISTVDDCFIPSTIRNKQDKNNKLNITL